MIDRCVVLVMHRNTLHVWPLLACLVVLFGARSTHARDAPAGEATPAAPVAQPEPPTATVPTVGDAPAPAPAPAAADPSVAGLVLLEEPDAEDPRVVLAASLRLRATRVHQLVAGTLEPSIHAPALFAIQLDAIGGDAVRLRELVSKIEEAIAQAREEANKPRRRHSPPRVQPAPEPTPTRAPETDVAQAQADLVGAYAAFFSLPTEEASARLSEHAAKVAERDRELNAEANAAAKLEEVVQRTEQLEAFLRGELEPAIDPAALLKVDLLEQREILRMPHRRAGVLGEAAAAPESTKPDEVPAVLTATEVALREAEQRLDRARLAYLELTAEERSALLAKHTARELAAEAPPEPPPVAEPEVPIEFVDEEAVKDEAEISESDQDAADAAREREEALEVARQARTEALRYLAEEKARLLGVKEQQALFAGSLPRWKQQARELHEAALEWHRKVGDLDGAGLGDADLERSADAMYGGLRQSLDETRAELAVALARVAAPGADIPRPEQDARSGPVPTDVERSDLGELRAELLAQAETLETEAAEVGWEVAELLRDDILVLNGDRLSLLSRASADLRGDVTGLGADGLQEVKRESSQIVLEFRYRAMALPRNVRAIVAFVEARPVEFMLTVLQLLIVLAVFRWWRRRADDLLRGWGKPPRRGYSYTRRARAGRQALWYMQRVRNPIEWILMLVVLPFVVGGAQDLPELRLVWLGLVWILGGWGVIVFVDALAARQTTYGSPSENAELRLRSLRVIGVTITSVGLILSITADIVGQGAIYHWVFQSCWVLVAPIGLWLVLRWRPTIFERVGAITPRNVVVDWITANSTGAAGFPAAAFGGLYLLYVGVSRWALRQLSGLDATRKVLAYLFRREVAKRAEATSARPRGAPIEGSLYAKLGPESAATTAPVLSNPARKQLQEAVEMTRRSASTLSAVVGERGSGKTTFLKRIVKGTDQSTCIVGCPPEGFDALLEALAVQFEAEDYSQSAVADAIRRAGAAIVCIDDAQRMISPSVGGLEQLDRFTRFALEVGGDVAWVVAVQRAAWHFVGRARGERVFFDQVLVLPRWSEEEIADLINSRCTDAGIEASFDELVVSTDASDEPSEERRTELGYYRILWDHSAGNPAVALQAWRQSLFKRSDENKPVVRLFVEPTAGEIEELPLTLLFVLRAVVQLEVASVEEIADCTQLPAADVADALRFSVTRGYAEAAGSRFRLSWPWYRTITTVLTRQHLLVA